MGRRQTVPGAMPPETEIPLGLRAETQMLLEAASPRPVVAEMRRLDRVIGALAESDVWVEAERLYVFRVLSPVLACLDWKAPGLWTAVRVNNPQFLPGDGFVVSPVARIDAGVEATMLTEHSTVVGAIVPQTAVSRSLRRRFLAAVGAAFTVGLAACSSDDEPRSAEPWQPSMQASAYSVLYGRATPRPVQRNTEIVFGIPRCDPSPGTDCFSTGPDIDYVETRALGPLEGRNLVLSADVEIDPGATIHQSDNGDSCPAEPRVRLLLRVGTDLTNEVHRWWSVPPGGSMPLTAGSHTITVPLAGTTDGVADWKAVLAQTAETAPEAFADVKRSLTTLGFTFGGCFAGHGVNVSGGTARFVLREFRIER